MSAVAAVSERPAHQSIASFLRRIPRLAIACALVAFLNAAVWSLLVPPFHGPDEPQHIAYAQYVAENAAVPPDVNGLAFADEEARAFEATRFNVVVGNERAVPLRTDRQTAAVDRVLDDDALARGNGGGETHLTNYPPGSYAAYAAAYWIGSGGDIFDRIALMRLVSALLVALTVLFVFLFLREVFPGTPWAWPIGALTIAVAPMVGFIGGVVNNDNLLLTCAAAACFLLAAAFRRGLSTKIAIALGIAVVVGTLAKPQMLALTPGIALGGLVCVLRAPAGPERRAALRAGLVGAAIVVIALSAYIAINALVWGRLATGGATNATSDTSGRGGSLASQLSYIWQLYLPRLPWLYDPFPEGTPLRTIWIDGWVGRFGWLDYGFKPWVSDIAVAVVAVVGALAATGLVRARATLARRWPELVSYGLMAAGLMVLIGMLGYRYRLDTGNLPFEQVRYVFPLLPFLAALIVLAARGAGRRAGPAVGALLVMITLAQGLFAQLLTLNRYYL